MVDGSGLMMEWVATALAATAVAYTVAAALLVRRRYFHRVESAAQDRPGVTLLKPLFLDEPGLADNLRSFFRQQYARPVQIIFGVRSHSDPALPVAEKIASEFPGFDVAFVVNPGFVGLNPKIANLSNMLARAKHDILIASDSDIRVAENYVETIVAELAQPDVGAVTCLYRGEPHGNIWAVLEAMHIDYAFLPNVVFGTSLGLTKPCFGSTIALKRSTLGEIGGFGAASGHLADDYELGRAIRAKGYAIHISSIVVRHICSEATATGLLRHELRWAKTIRFLNPAGFAGSIVTHAFPLCLIAAWALGSVPLGGGLVAAGLVARLFLVWRLRTAFGVRPGPMWLLPVRDVLSFFVFLASFFGNSVYWAGTRYFTTPDGALAQR